LNSKKPRVLTRGNLLFKIVSLKKLKSFSGIAKKQTKKNYSGDAGIRVKSKQSWHIHN
jgi:hypothetical protein